MTDDDELSTLREAVKARIRARLSRGILTAGVSQRLLSRVDWLQAELAEQCRLNAMGSEREARLMAQVQELIKERDDLLKSARYWAGLPIVRQP